MEENVFPPLEIFSDLPPHPSSSSREVKKKSHPSQREGVDIM